MLLILAICAGVSCGQPDIPSNGHVNTSAGTSFMDVARYSCVEGYVLSGPAERSCQADQQWSGSVPACESEMLQCSVQLFFCVYGTNLLRAGIIRADAVGS